MKRSYTRFDVPTTDEKLDYIACLLRSLSELATGRELRELRLYLEMAAIEARDVRDHLQSDHHLRSGRSMLSANEQKAS